MKKILLLLLIVGLLGITGWRVLRIRSSTVVGVGNSLPAPTATPTLDARATPTPSLGFDKKQFSIDDPSSLWVVVNKKRPLPLNYIPADLVVPKVTLRLASSAEQMHVRSAAATALEELLQAGSTAGHSLHLSSGYRSVQYQKQLYDSYVAKDGVKQADTYSARPGHSEHQTGLAVDVGYSDGTCELEICLGEKPAGQWLKAHAFEYGFIIRYEQDKTSITGYQYEPWHLRYVGKELAEAVEKTKEPLETFFGLEAAPDYQ